MKTKYFTALTIAGSDSCSGAGIQADLKTFSALKVYGCTAITAVTAQNTTEVSQVYLLPSDLIRNQILAVINDIKIDAIKIGMLGSQKIVTAVSQTIKNIDVNIPIVLDPVIVATSGNKLIEDSAIEAMKQELIPQATLITPNIPEAQILTKIQKKCQSVTNMQEMIEPLLHLGAKYVLLKGGHLDDQQNKTDILASKTQLDFFSNKSINIGKIHGTGCTLAAAITAFLAKGNNLFDSVTQAEQYLKQALSYIKYSPKGKGSHLVNHGYYAQFT